MFVEELEGSLLLLYSDELLGTFAVRRQYLSMRLSGGGAHRVFSGLECGGGAMLGSWNSQIQLLVSRGLKSGQATQRKAEVGVRWAKLQRCFSTGKMVRGQWLVSEGTASSAPAAPPQEAALRSQTRAAHAPKAAVKCCTAKRRGPPRTVSTLQPALRGCLAGATSESVKSMLSACAILQTAGARPSDQGDIPPIFALPTTSLLCFTVAHCIPRPRLSQLAAAVLPSR